MSSEARSRDYLLNDAGNVLGVPCAGAEEDTELRQAEVLPLPQSKGLTSGQRCAT